MTSVVAAAVVVGVLAWHNGRHLAPAPHNDVVASLVTVVGAGVAAWWLLGRVDLLAGIGAAVAWTLGAGLLAGVVTVAATRSRRIGRIVADRRMAAMEPGEFALHVSLRIPVLTALAEEVVHRGLVWWAVDRAAGPMAALWASTAVFALGHVQVAREQAHRERRDVVTWVMITVVATGVAGLGLGLLRLWTGGIWAGVGVHAAVNMVLAFGGRFARQSEPAA
jgi:membrane protease YdiL (CAAX protease family)